MRIDIPLIEQLVADVCCSMLGLPVAADDAPGQSHTDDRCATIHITGDWEALVELNAAEAACRACAGAMFAKDPDELSDDDVRDAVGEIVNMLGGNLKGMVAGESSLSLPCVGLRVQRFDWLEEPVVVSRHFRCGAHPFRVSVIQPQAALVGELT